MNLLDPQGLAMAPTTTPLVELMDWLASPDGGALRMDQSIDIARAIARGDVPHVGMMPRTTPDELARRVVDIELQSAEAATKAALISLGWTPPPAVDFLADLVANRGVEIAASPHLEPFEQLTAHMVAPCGTKIRIDAEYFDIGYVTTALAARGWIVTLLQRAE